MFCIGTLIGTACYGQKVGFLMDNLVEDRWNTDKRHFVSSVENLGGECIVKVADGDADTQVRMARELVVEGVDVMVVIPTNAQKAVQIVEIAHDADIPVVAYDRLIPSKDVDVYISYDNHEVGRLQANAALKANPKGNYVVINGPNTDLNAGFFKAGQYDMLLPKINSGDINILDDIVLDDWSELPAFIALQEVMNKGEKIDVVISAYDGFSSAVISGLNEEAAKRIFITGQDAQISAIKSIKTGLQNMTVYKPLKQLAVKAAEVAMLLATEEGVPDADYRLFANLLVPSILFEPISVNASNLEETVVADGHVKASDLE
ncbi:MAG: substrate-binding domain-containing protein [Cyclobacteriaceae bacterium]